MALRRSTNWKIAFGLLALWAGFSFYVASIMSGVYGSILLYAHRELLTNLLFLALLPALLVGLWKPRAAAAALFGIALIHLLLGLIELRIPNAVDDFGELPNHLSFGERLIFGVLPAVLSAFLFRIQRTDRATAIEAS